METLRTYGEPPFDIVLVHGGPGAAGEMAPVARELSSSRGVLEPLQTALTLEGQVEELRSTVEVHAAAPAVLAGFSWGAWLALLVAARHPSLVKKLILIGSGPFDETYAARIEPTRLGRLSDGERHEVGEALDIIEGRTEGERQAAFARFGELYSKADTFEALPGSEETVEFRPDIFKAVWPEAADLRRSGGLLRAAATIRCPVVAIHGDFDPHPAEGVRVPLASAVDDFRMILLKRCGHKPWIERHARREFFRLLEREL